ncbi:Tetratricopeptide repeat (TPR)-like superfamily protein [Quillaja saponaria]|uniref:Tetratricopeptide repeat (TPR)-like superfamily protein n=1 Tax=Quillaja saponaria TaxID=32244 RepID=A0AAD7PS46_QUISA|nr:Tetratricopeptide repeat (TPR)-like superfamily protein [Quillaja saponaria]
MFSIAAINDTDSKSQWEPLAPTKEAQEFHISQTYHEGLLKLQSKDYEMARKFLESVLDDPLVVNAQVESSASDGHLLQLRFLALKNLATVFLQQGSAYYENALHCYLQAVEIDSKDSVVWNQLGTLSCSMGSLSISRWAFEQGLLCSPNNWNCMEKLLEVLIAIGDEVACLLVAELILRHWPSHSRALLVKNTIEESEPVSFSPRGIDKLEPKHVRLEFPNKRKATNKSLDENVAIKKLNQTIELRLTEVSWSALTDALLEILLPGNVKSSEMGPEKVYKSGDVKLSIHLPSSLENVVDPPEGKSDNGEHLTFGDTERASNIRDREANILEEQPHERRSSRLERLRSRKPGKEESDACGKDPSKVVSRFLETFIAGAQHIGDTVGATTSSNSLDTEYSYVSRFVREASKNFGAYHVGHLLLEEIARRGLTHQAAFVKFLELEKVTRHWGKDRTCECSLFLAELYYDFGLCSSSASKRSKFMSEASYHLCKIVESVALDYPFHLNCFQGNGSCSSGKSFQETSGTTKNSTYHGSHAESSLLTSNCSFWIRFFWLSGRLSILDGKKGKAHEEFCISLSLLAKKEDADGSICALHLPHCKATKVLSIDRILYEVNMLKVDFLMEKSVAETIEKEMYLECVTLLSPLLFATKDVYIDALSFNIADRKDEMINSIEISALDILVKACQKTKPMDIEVYLNCHRRKLQILMAASGFDEYLSSCKPSHQNQGVYTLSSSDIDSKESSSKNYNHLIAKEVKALSQCVSQVKTFIDSSGDFNDNIVPVSSLVDIQTLLLSIISNAANTLLCRKSVPEVSDQVESCCFVDAAIVFCKLQHLNPTVPVKTQVDLIVAMHDLLAEYGLCCAGEGGAGEEGAFLRFAIKHLLALDVKFKSNFNPFNRERTRYEEKISQNSLVKTSLNESKSDTLDVQMERTKIDEASGVEKDASEELSSKGTSSHKAHNKDTAGVEYGNEGRAVSNCKFNRGENSTNQLIECGSELNEDEKEQLESKIDNALDQCFFCLYGLNLRSDSSYEDDLVMHRNTSRGDYQTKEQCADVFQYILPYAKASSRTGLIKLRRVLRAIRKHFPQPPEDVLTGNPIDKFLDDLGLCEDQLSEEAGSDEFLETISKTIFPDAGGLTHYKASTFVSSEPYLEVYCNLYYFLALSEEMSATDKWPGFVLTKEGEEFVQQNAKLFKFDLLYNPLRFQSWQRLANIYDEEVDLLLNDGSKHINVVGWRKNATLPQRVETSRRRSRRCLLMSLALANTSAQQCEIHELLALVYYDSLQNVVPFYDQRSAVPTKDAAWMMFCENSMKHFKKAYTHKQDWLYAFYLGKLSEKLGCSHDAALSYYDRAIALNPSAVDPVYRMHASRLKLLYTCGKHNSEALKILSAYSFNQSVGEAVTNIFCEIDSSLNTKDRIVQANFEEKKCEGLVKLEEVWHMLYNDCLSGLETCVEGDLKHFHKARYMLAQGLYKRGGNGDLERAKDELSFCFKSSRSSFTINMWEIDSMVKKGRRKTPGSSGNKKVLEVNLPESSRKFITCIRKYVLLYLKLLEETGDICTLDRAYISLRADKRFSLCIEDIVPVALGRHLKALISSMHQPQNISSDAASSTEQVLEKMFGLFMEHGNLWPEICSLPEIKSPDVSDNGLYGYLHEHIVSLERDGKLETLEAINEKIRKRFKNPKLSNSNCAKVCRHASVAWCRSLINSLASITPLQPGFLSEIRDLNSTDGGMDTLQLLCVDLQTRELWNTAFEDSTNSKNLKTKWSPVLSKIKNIMIKKASDENLETANALLRSSYNFYRESSCVLLTSGVNLYLVSSRLALDTQFHPSMNGVETLDLSIPRKLLLWAYTLLHGRYTNISVVVKHCEENVKSKVKRGSGTSSVSSNPSCAAASHTSSAKDVDMEATPMATVASASLPGGNNTQIVNSLPSSGETQKNYFASPQLHQCNNTVAERTDLMAHEGGPDKS